MRNTIGWSNRIIVGVLLAIIAGPFLNGAGLALGQANAGAVDEWPQWRGPRRDNLPVLKSMPEDLSKGLKQIWEAKELCKDVKVDAAYSCPVIFGDKLIVTGRAGDQDLVQCLNADTGALIWKQQYDAPAIHDVQYGNGPRATPTIDGTRVYTFGCMGQLACWELADGKQIWTTNVAEQGGKQPMWGFASSPLVLDDRVIVQTGGQAAALAFDKKTGKESWASPAGPEIVTVNKATGGASSSPAPAGYSAPIPYTINGQTVLLVAAFDTCFALNPSSGAKIWSVPWHAAFGMNCTTPRLIDGKQLLLCCSNVQNTAGAGLFDLKADGPVNLWTSNRFGAAHNDPVIIDGLLYAYTGFSMDDKGTLVCVDMNSGEIKWSSKEVGGPGTVLQVGKQILALNNRGKLILIDPSGDGLKKVSEFQAINGHPVWTLPVITHNKLYIRCADHLICYAVSE